MKYILAPLPFVIIIVILVLFLQGCTRTVYVDRVVTVDVFVPIPCTPDLPPRPELPDRNFSDIDPEDPQALLDATVRLLISRERMSVREQQLLAAIDGCRGDN